MNKPLDDSKSEMEKIASELKGKTLRVYWYLLKNPEETSLRTIQRGASLSSPSLATYHLKKLENLGLISTDPHGLYHLERTVKIGMLRFFVGSGRVLMPRYLFYATFYTTPIPSSLIFLPLSTGPVSLLFLIVLSFGMITNWIETYRIYRMEIQ
jgi:hypothetical protein